MAAETPQQAAAPAPEGGHEAPPSKGGGGLSSFLPLIIALVVMPVAAWVTIELKSRMDKKAAASGTEAEKEPVKSNAETKEKSSGHGESKEKKGTGSSKTKGRNIHLSVPLTREAVAFVAAKDAEEGKPKDVDKIVTMDTKGETKDIAQADKIVVNIANTHGMRYAVARISFLSDDPEFLDKLNEKREVLLDKANGILGSKTLDEIETVGFKSLLRLDLKAQFESALGRSGIIREVIITEFIVQ